MSTKATLIIKDSKTGEKCYLYHHCDGYSLDEELDNLLQYVVDSNWTVPALRSIVINMDEAYGTHPVISVGWDSEYVYVIDAANKTLKKYECGLWFESEHYLETMNIEEEKTQEKYHVGTWAYGEDGQHFNERVEVLETTLDDAMRAGYLKGVAALQKSLIGPSLKRSLGLTDEEVQTVFKLMAE